MEFCLRKDGLLETAAEIQRNLGMTNEKTGKKNVYFFPPFESRPVKEIYFAKRLFDESGLPKIFLNAWFRFQPPKSCV